MNASGHPSQLTGCSLWHVQHPVFDPHDGGTALGWLTVPKVISKFQFNPGNYIPATKKKKTTTWKDKNCIILADSNFTVELFLKIVGLLCASRSHSVGEKGSVHWRTIAKNNVLYSNIIIIKQTAWFSNDTRMIEDGLFFFLFWFASTWYRLRCNLLNLLLVGLRFQNQRSG